MLINDKIEKQKSELIKQNAEIESQRAELSLLLQTRDKLFS